MRKTNNYIIYLTPLTFLPTHWNPKLNQLETSNQKEKPPILPFHRFNQFSSSFITPLSLISSLALSIKKETQESLIPAARRGKSSPACFYYCYYILSVPIKPIALAASTRALRRRIKVSANRSIAERARRLSSFPLWTGSLATREGERKARGHCRPERGCMLALQ